MRPRPLRYLDSEKGRDGIVRHWYFRRNGQRWPLPGDPNNSQEASAEYWRLRAATEPEQEGKRRAAHAPGSWGALTAAYFASPEFKNRAPAQWRRSSGTRGERKLPNVPRPTVPNRQERLEIPMSIESGPLTFC